MEWSSISGPHKAVIVMDGSRTDWFTSSRLKVHDARMTLIAGPDPSWRKKKWQPLNPPSSHQPPLQWSWRPERTITGEHWAIASAKRCGLRWGIYIGMQIELKGEEVRKEYEGRKRWQQGERKGATLKYLMLDSSFAYFLPRCRCGLSKKQPFCDGSVRF